MQPNPTSAATWRIAATIMKRHNGMTLRLLASIFSLLFSWSCVLIHWLTGPVIPWQIFHPGLYHDFFTGAVALWSAMLQSPWRQWVFHHPFVTFFMVLFTYMPTSYYCVKMIFNIEFDGFNVVIKTQRHDN